MDVVKKKTKETLKKMTMSKEWSRGPGDTKSLFHTLLVPRYTFIGLLKKVLKKKKLKTKNPPKLKTIKF